ncbi:MAG: crosslink repair DNA glycosylase YcaQ family protein [Candidatus Dojkabacteria bacterium]|nr:crosslink repair DNA glycosylase YcaQ family protein [Candidatus Dojkabacteria bacterium]MDQ7021154.1 crosslink repair DNA glycosylase YcaQ family protein [Candidatus Dojkabacteria bacterium]
MIPLNVSKKEITAFLLARSFLYNNSPDINHVLESLSCIQVDPIQVVGKSHEIALWNRIDNISRKEIDSQLYKQRNLFEYWLQLYSIIPVKFFPFLKIRMNISGSWQEEYYKKHRSEVDDVLEYVREFGPTKSSDLSHLNAGTSLHNWGKAKLSHKALLEFLWDRGQLVIHSRESNNKIYDLVERYIPNQILKEEVTEKESIKFIIKSQFKYLEIFRKSFLSNRIGYSKFEISTIFKEMLEEGEIIELKIQDVKRKYYILVEDLTHLEKSLKNSFDGIKLLSPLDPLVIDRTLLEDIFEFYYRWEAYVPKSKRKIGPYGMPIIKDGEFIGQVQFEKSNNYKLSIRKMVLKNNSLILKSEINAVGLDLSNFLQSY